MGAKATSHTTHISLRRSSRYPRNGKTHNNTHTTNTIKEVYHGL